MRSLIKRVVLLSFSFFLFSKSFAQNVSEVGAHVYKPIADSLGVKMYKAVFKPGDMIPMHMHPDHALYVLEGGTMELTMKDGKKEIMTVANGMAAIFGEETHAAKNIGTTTIQVVVVEIRRPRK